MTQKEEKSDKGPKRKPIGSIDNATADIRNSNISLRRPQSSPELTSDPANRRFRQDGRRSRVEAEEKKRLKSSGKHRDSDAAWRLVRAEFEKPNIIVNISYAALFHTVIMAVISSVAAAYLLLANQLSGWASVVVTVPLYLAGAVVISVMMRSLENMVHEASHMCWHRKNRFLNHAFANLLAAYPVFQSVSDYWDSHRVHHAKYSRDDDPCMQRYLEMGFENLIDLSVFGLVLACAKRYPRYVLGYYRQMVSRPLILAVCLVWHFVVYIFPISLALGMVPAILIWLAFIVIPGGTALQFLRLLAEAGEHRYGFGEGVTESTYSNLGWLQRWIIHPYYDGYHWLHHVYPNVPLWRCRELHLYLQMNGQYANSNLRRERLLQNQKIASGE